MRTIRPLAKQAEQANGSMLMSRDRILTTHTGGAVGLFGYTGVFEQALAAR